ncbi:MAG: hypothetical protein ACLGI6_16705 [Gammaproteobacteria bacterium]
MNKKAIPALLGAVLLTALSACGDKNGPNEKNLGAAVTQYFAKKGELCLETITWPVDVYATDLRQIKVYPDGVAGQMAALEAAGLAKGEDVEAPGKPKVRRYTLADAAKPFVRETKPGQFNICGGRKTLDKVVRWDDPKKVGDHLETGVVYTYAIANLPEWAKKPQMQEAFGPLGDAVKGQRSAKEKLAVRQTAQGWEAL